MSKCCECTNHFEVIDTVRCNTCNAILCTNAPCVPDHMHEHRHHLETTILNESDFTSEQLSELPYEMLKSMANYGKKRKVV